MEWLLVVLGSVGVAAVLSLWGKEDEVRRSILLRVPRRGKKRNAYDRIVSFSH